MTFDEAKEYQRRFIKAGKSIHATSDGSFYVDANPDFLLAHAKENGLEIFTIKGQEIKPESAPQIDSESTDKPAKKK